MNILVTENYNRKDIFEIVDEYPHGYIVCQSADEIFRLQATCLSQSQPTNLIILILIR